MRWWPPPASGGKATFTPHSGYLSAILGPAIVISIGGGLLNTPVNATVTSGIADADAGAASGLMNTTKQFGGALGLAALVAVSEAHDHAPGDVASGYSRAFLAIAAILVVVAVTALGLPGRGRHRPDRSVPPTPADEVRPQSDDEATQCGTTC